LSALFPWEAAKGNYVARLLRGVAPLQRVLLVPN
jgi:hypothetical protein